MTQLSLMPKKRKTTFKIITIVLESGSKMPTIHGKWERLPDGRVRARYTPDEYELCMQVFEATRATERAVRGNQVLI